MQEKISFCVSSQTPIARFKVSPEELYEKYGEVPEPLPLDMLTRGEDYVYAPGGVTRILPPLLRSLYKKKKIKNPHWISLNPMAPETTIVENIILHNIELDSRESVRYGRFKESLWKNVHGVERELIPKGIFSGYAVYNWLTAKKMMDLHSEFDFDIFHINDFQLLQAGSILGPTAPKLFWWHIPIKIEHMLPEWRKFLLHYFDSYDATIVNCKRYKESLSKAGIKDNLYQLYPHIDPKDYGIPSNPMKRQFSDEYGIEDEDQVALVVARLDPMKGQDIAIKALSHLKRKYPSLKLVLVGDGSFSSAKKGGLGLPKGLRWKRELDSLSGSLGIGERVIFTGHLPDEGLWCAFERSDVVILSSVLEGFGLTVLEGWQYKKPVIVSSKAGVAELVRDGENSYIFDPSNPRELAEKIDALLSDDEHAIEMGEKGRESVKKHYLEENVKKFWTIVEDVLER